MRSALERHDFGSVFALARKWAGISYSKIAEACEIKPERVGTLARGEGSITTYDKITRIADALRIPGHLIGLAPRPWEPASPQPRTALTAQALPVGYSLDLTRTAPDPNGDGSVLRRDFVRTSLVGSGLVVGLAGIAALPRGRRVGSEVPRQLRERTARLRRLDDVLGGGDTYRVYLGEYQSTESLLRDASYSEPTGRALLSVLSEQAQQVGWAAFDAGDQQEAKRLYEASHRAAAEAGDAALAGNALAFLAYQRINGDKAAAVRIAAESCRTAGDEAPTGVRALLYERLAWAHAVAGDASETERALGIAEAALADTDDSPQPDWVGWVDRDEIQIMTGRCWTELRRPLRAVPVLEHVLAGFDDTRARDKALYLSWLADSYLAASEIEQAAEVTSRALDLSSGVASVRPRERIASVIRQLEPHHRVPAVAAVLDKARS